MSTAFQRIEPGSPVYQEFARLYRLAREMRPSQTDRWNGELYARTDGLWGGFDPKTHSMRLSPEVLAELVRLPPEIRPHEQARALATVLHETYHARTEIDAPAEPNAFRGEASRALDEGLTEYIAVADLEAFGRRAGRPQIVLDAHEYQAEHEATTRLLDYAVGPGNDRIDLAQQAADAPVVMRWDVIANEVVRNRLADIVPADARHQQAARAELVNAMAHAGWQALANRPAEAGRLVAHDSAARLDAAVGRIQQHYRDNPGRPYPAVAPNRAAAVGLDGEQARTAQATGRGPQAANVARPEPGIPAPGQTRPPLDPAFRAALSGQAPPSGAVSYRPSLGDGARGRSGDAGHQAGRTPNTPPERGDR